MSYTRTHFSITCTRIRNDRGEREKKAVFFNREKWSLNLMVYRCIANEWIVYPCYTHVSFQMNAISLCVIILSSIKILATIPLFMLSLHNSFMLFSLQCRAVPCRAAPYALMLTLPLSPLLHNLFFLRFHALLFPALPPTQSLIHYLFYINIYDAFYCWLIWWCWFVDSDIGLTLQFNWLSTACGVAKSAEHIYCRIQFRLTIYQSPCFFSCHFSFALAFVHLFVFVFKWTKKKNTQNNSDGTKLILLIY